MKSMRLLLYSFNILIIQILNKINRKLFPYEIRYVIGERICYSEYEEDEFYGKIAHISCCDCGASHLFWKAWNGIYGIPVRPIDYKYRMRLKFEQPSFADETARQKWDTNR